MFNVLFEHFDDYDRVIPFMLYACRMRWTVEILNETVVDELTVLPRDIRAKFEHIITLIETF